MWQRLFRGTSGSESGTIFQLRNLIFRRNIYKDVTKHMNATEDFFELIVICYIIAAAMIFFAMQSTNDVPHANDFLESIACKSVPERTRYFRDRVLRLVDRYVLLSDLPALAQQTSSVACLQQSVVTRKRPRECMDNPHLQRIAADHCYIGQQLEPPVKQRCVPNFIAKHADVPHASVDQQRLTPDGVLNYSSSVLNGGLLMLEFKDAVREGDGMRIIRCWKIMMIYFKHANHANYAKEAFRMLAYIYALGTPRLVHQITWGRVVNTHGGQGHNISLDLQMEHMNKKVKECVGSFGANVSEKLLVQSGKSLKGIMDICNHFDGICQLQPLSSHHTIASSLKDIELVLQELLKSRVFDYIPGRKHKSFPNIKQNVFQEIDVEKYMKYLATQKQQLIAEITYRKLHAS